MSLQVYPISQSQPVYAFTTQCQGGISSGQYTSFNLGRYSGDSLKHVECNFEILAKIIQLSKNKVITPHQTHEDKIVNIDHHFLSQSLSVQNEILEGVDALITDQKEICIGITTADCVPILLYDPIHHASAAIHAGWKSTVKNIVSKTIDVMQKSYNTCTKDLLVVIGPCISSNAFEVGFEVLEQFETRQFQTKEFTYNSETGKFHIDLRLANLQLLQQAGVDITNVHVDQTCTYSSLLYFSARRQGFASGRMLTGICLQ